VASQRSGDAKRKAVRGVLAPREPFGSSNLPVPTILLASHSNATPPVSLSADLRGTPKAVRRSEAETPKEKPCEGCSRRASLSAVQICPSRPFSLTMSFHSHYELSLAAPANHSSTKI